MIRLSYLNTFLIVAGTWLAGSAIANETASLRYLEKKAFKQSGLEKKLPQLFVVNAQGNAVYYQIGGSKEDFSELLKSRDRAEDTDFTESSWSLLKKLPEVARMLEETKGQNDRIILVSADPDWFDCTACTIQKDSLAAYQARIESNIYNFYIR